MRIALDPFMHRHLSLEELPRRVRELGYDWIEMSPRGDFLEWFKAPRVFPERIKAFRRALDRESVKIASLLPMYRWASDDESERVAAVRHWKRAIEIAIEMEVDTMNSEFGRGPHPDKGGCYCCHTGSMIEACEDSWWRSMEELVPIFEREKIMLHIEPHPEDWCETLQPAVDIIRTVNSKNVRFLYCAPHTFYFGDDTKAMLRECADVLAHVHVGDTFNHKASSGLRYILNPPGTTARVHQHLNIGQGEVPWEDFFGTLAEIGFDGIMTACVFAWEDKADESSRLCARRCSAYVDKHRKP
jgi:myo-inositol catabolism protein IolH